MTPRLKQLLAKESWTQWELREIRTLTYEHHERYDDQEAEIYTPRTTRRTARADEEDLSDMVLGRDSLSHSADTLGDESLDYRL